MFSVLHQTTPDTCVQTLVTGAYNWKQKLQKQCLSHSMRQADTFKSANNAGWSPLNGLRSLIKPTVVYSQLGTIAIDFCPQSEKSYVYAKTW